MFTKQTPQTAEEARQYAIEYQQWQSENSQSWDEVIGWGKEFRTLAEKFDLVEEFRENGII